MQSYELHLLTSLATIDSKINKIEAQTLWVDGLVIVLELVVMAELIVVAELVEATTIGLFP